MHKDHEERKRWDRERQRRRRAAAKAGPGIAPPEKLRVVADVEALLLEASTLARNDPKAKGVERARVLNSIASTSLRLVEAHDLSERLDDLEAVVRRPPADA